MKLISRVFTKDPAVHLCVRSLIYIYIYIFLSKGFLNAAVGAARQPPVASAPRSSGADSLQENSLIILVLGNFPGGGAGKVYFLGFALGKKYQSHPSPAWDCLAEIMEITVIVWGWWWGWGGGRLWADGGLRGNIDGGDNRRDNIPFYIIYLQPH